MLIHGGCHCGNIAFELVWAPDPQQIPARACGCSFCRKHGGVWTANPQGILRIRIGDDGQVTRYTFATGTAVFHVCRSCGIAPFVTSEIDGRTYAVVSVNAFDDVDPALLRHAPVFFDGESLDARLERRKRHWIGDVRFEPKAL